MTEPMIPRDPAAERAVLGACMESAAGWRTVAPLLSAADFYEPRNGLIFEHIGRCVAAHTLADPVILLDSLRAAGEVTRAGGAVYLHTLYHEAPLGDVSAHARIVADCATRRKVIVAGRRAVQRAESGTGDVADLVEAVLADVQGTRDTRTGVDRLTVPVDEFMSVTADVVDWVVPGLLARGDRFVLTGTGGVGKSTLLQQFAVCAAAGIPPFDWHTDDTFTPARVMIMDCENADHQLKTRLWPMLREARDNGTPVEDRLTVGGHGNPLNLLDSNAALSLLRTVEHDRPDLLYIGPVYKLHADDPDKEVVVKRITHVLDQVREMGCALVAEAHHTKASKHGGSLEPSGSNVWTWWPEFGRGLRLDVDSDPVVRRCALEPWRIDRVQRSWPTWVEFGGKWPWARSAANPYFNAARIA